MPTPAMVVEVKLSEAVPNTTAAEPSLTSNPGPYNTPQPTGDIVVPNSPDGVVTGPVQDLAGVGDLYISPATFNYVETISSTSEMLTNVLGVESAQEGESALANSTVQATVSGLGVTSSSLQPYQINNWYSGTVGKVGSKFT